MHVCHLAKYYPPATGGMERHVQTLARAQAELGARVTVVCVNHREPSGRDATWRMFARTATVREQDGPVEVIRLGRCANLARLDVCPGLPSVLGQQEGDVLHLHTPNPLMLLALDWLGLAKPLVITHHSDVVRQRMLGWLLQPFGERVYRRAGRILVSSPPLARGSAVLARHQSRLEVVPFGIDLEPFLEPGFEARQSAERLRRELGEPLWLCVGRLVYYKGHALALSALARLPGRLLVIGTGPLQASLARQAQALGVAGRVRWLGEVSDTELAGVYHAATALWFPSNARSEAFGLVQVEAMASGCPVINTALEQSGVPWVSRHEETGLTVPVNDAEALAHAAQRLLDEPGLRKRLSDQARRRARDEFDKCRMAQRCLEIYRSVTAVGSLSD
jgi:rhamnosyl/mannosyltransferase